MSKIQTIKVNTNNIGNIKNISASMKFKNKKVGTYLSNWDSPGRWSIKIFGSGYTIIFDPLEKGKIIFSNLKEKKLFNHQNKTLNLNLAFIYK